MNINSLLDTLLSAARRHPTSDHVPYAFEQRVMAYVRELRPIDRVSAWTRGLWQAALSSLAVAAVLVGANAFAPDTALESAVDPLETAVVASVDFVPDVW